MKLLVILTMAVLLWMDDFVSATDCLNYGDKCVDGIDEKCCEGFCVDGSCADSQKNGGSCSSHDDCSSKICDNDLCKQCCPSDSEKGYRNFFGDHFNLTATSFTAGTDVVATCDSGFKLNIESDMYFYRGTDNRLQQIPNPPDVVMSVVLKCDIERCQADGAKSTEITAVANTLLDGYMGTNYSLFGTRVDLNSYCFFVPETDDDSVFNRTKLTCDIIENFCPELKDPDNGMAEMTKGRKIGSVARSKCEGGHKVVGNNEEITCENNGEWSSETLPNCSAQATGMFAVIRAISLSSMIWISVAVVSAALAGIGGVHYYNSVKNKDDAPGANAVKSKDDAPSANDAPV